MKNKKKVVNIDSHKRKPKPLTLEDPIKKQQESLKKAKDKLEQMKSKRKRISSKYK